MTEQFARTEAGRKWMSRLTDRLRAGEDVPPEKAAEMAVVLATGELDDLHGRFLHGAEDAEQIESLRARAADIAENDARTLRVR